MNKISGNHLTPPPFQSDRRLHFLTMNCIIYTRFSPRRNADRCESCEVQLAYCEQYAAQKGWRVSAVFEDRAVSGSVEIDAREIHNAIASLKKGDILLAYRRDRLARELIIGLEIERAVASRGASVAVVQGDVFGASNDPGVVMMKQMLMVIAEYERKIIGARTSAAMLHHIRNGRLLGKHPPFGWSVDPADPRRIVRDESEQRTRSEILELHRNGHGYNEIARLLSPSSSRTGRWHPQNIKNIIAHAERDGAI